MTNWNSWLCFVHFFTQTSSSWCHKAHNVTKLVDFLVGIDGASTLHLLNSLRPKEIEAFSNDTSISVKTNVIIVKSDVKSPIIPIFSQLQVNYSKKVVTKTLTFYWKRGIAESQSNFLFFWYQNIQIWRTTIHSQRNHDFGQILHLMTLFARSSSEKSCKIQTYHYLCLQRFVSFIMSIILKMKEVTNFKT